MKRFDHLLWVVAEESTEVAQVGSEIAQAASRIAQRASKAARFGIAEVQPGQDKNNYNRLFDEFADLCGAIELLDKPNKIEDIIAVLRPKIDAKKAKTEKFLLYSAEQGTLDAPKV